jgi:hypothetical protein
MRDRQHRLAGPAGPAALAALASIALPACGASPASFDNEAAGNQGVSRVEHVKGSPLARVHLSARAAQRLGIRTAAVHTVRARRGRTVIPYGALLYDAAGTAYTYTNPAPLTYVRAPVDVLRTDGHTVLLRSGPRAGTPVVVVGAPELWGVENGVEED